MKLNENRFSATPEQTTMPEVESALTYKMFSASGRKIACTSLRPGMRLVTMSGTVWTVIQNSAKLKRVELRSGKMAMVQEYCWIAYDQKYHVLPPSWFYRLKKLFSK